MARVRAVEVSIDARDLVALFGKTSNVDKTLRTSLRRNMRVAAKTAADSSKAEVVKTPLSGGRSRESSGLRRDIARGIKVQVATGTTAADLVVRGIWG